MYESLTQFRTKHKLSSITELPDTTTFQAGIPREPIYHFMDSRDTLGPTTSDMFIAAILVEDDNEKIFVNHITDIPNPSDNLKKISGSERSVPVEYHKRNRRLSRALKLDRALRGRDPLVINYNPIFHTHRRVSERTEELYPDTLSYLDTLNQSIKRLDTKRLQFVVVNLPQIIPPEEELRKHIDKQTDTLRRSLKTFESIMLVELLKTMVGEEKTLDGLFQENVYLTLYDTGSIIHIDMNQYQKITQKVGDQQKLSWWLDVITKLVELRSVETDDVEESETYAQKITQDAEKEAKGDVRDETTLAYVRRLAAKGTVTERELKRHLELASSYRNIPTPTIGGENGNVKTVAELLEKQDNTSIALKPDTLPKFKGVGRFSADTTIRRMDEDYIANRFEADVIETTLAFQKGPFAVTNITREEVRDAGNHNVVYKIETKGIKGGKGKFPIVFPKIATDGTFQSGGVTYRMAAQRASFPLIKTGPSEVVLTSSMSKLFLTSGTKKKNDYYNWVDKKIKEKRHEGVVTELKFGNDVTNDPNIDVPPMLSYLGNKYKGFTVGTVQFDFTEETVKPEGKGWICGIDVQDNKKHTVIMLPNGQLMWSQENRSSTAKPYLLGSIEDLLGLDISKAPVPFAELKVKGKQVPMGILMAYWKGFRKSLKYLGIEYDVISATDKSRQSGSFNKKFVLHLEDVKVILKPNGALQTLFAAGWQDYHRELRELKFRELDVQKNYSVLFTPKGITKSHEIEFDLMEDFWIDPVTEKLLKSRDYPTEFFTLFTRAVEMLVDRQHHNENSGEVFIEKRYSRVLDVVYGEMVRAMRDYHRNGQPSRKISAPQDAILTKILMDESVSPVEQVNPLGVIGEQNRIVYSGIGGRTNRSLVGRHRVYDKGDRGRISEAFTDDGKAGTVMYYSAAPSIENVYGLPGKSDNNNLANQLSITMLLNPFVIYDDPKRGNYARIQENAWRSNNGRVVPPVVTGQSVLIAHQVGELYAFATTQAGKVTEVNDEAIVVEYADGTTKSYVLGLMFGTGAGKVYPRRLITDRAKGYKFEAHEILAWDDYFFYRDRYNKTQVSMYNGSWSITCFRERAGTYEDASRSSLRSSKRQASDVAHIRAIKVEFNENLKLNIKEGDVIEQDSVLAYIAPPGVEIKEEDQSSLDYYSAGSPKAKYSGRVEKMEVFYYGDTEGATDELKRAIRKSDSKRKTLAKYKDIHPTGEYKDQTYIHKQLMTENSAVIVVYIMNEELWGAGDKRAFANSLKTVPGKVYATEYKLLDGTPIDDDFSFKGQQARMTPGAEKLGVLGMNIRQIGLNGEKLSRGEKL